MIKTSIIIPVYNTSPYVEECINSVYNQTQKEIEVIAINDGSTDDSLQVLLNLKVKYPDLTVVSQDNQGLGYTRNLGINLAHGEYIYFLDSDDYILPDTIQNCYERASSNNLDMVFFDAYNFVDNQKREAILPNFDDRKSIIKEREEIFSGIYFFENYAKTIYEPACCFIYFSMDFIKRYNFKFLPNVYFEDNEFYCKALKYANKIMYIPEMFYQRRCRKDSITGSNFNIRKAKDLLYVINRITELREPNFEGAWINIKEINKSLLQYLAMECKNNDIYINNPKLSLEILNAYSYLYNKEYSEVNNIEELNYLVKISDTFEENSLEKERIKIKQNYILKEILEKLPLNKKEMSIVIYGCGNYTEKWMNKYEILVGKIQAKLGFIDTYVEDKNKKFRNYPVYNVREVKNVDLILISSSKYDAEMSEMIKKLYDDKFKVISLYRDLYVEI